MTEQSWDYSRRGRGACAADMQEAVRCLEGRWKMMILAHLSSGLVMRFSALQRAIPDVSQKMLIQQLRDLERDGVVLRTVHPQVPPKVEYELTDLGKKLRPVFVALLDWAAACKEAKDTTAVASNETEDKASQEQGADPLATFNV